MAAVSDFITQQGFLVLDGGLATELEQRGECLDHPLWSAKILLAAPEKIEDVHYSYFVAGADVAITASYQATFPGLQASGMNAAEAEQMIRSSVSVAIEARDRFWGDPQNQRSRLRPLIAASVGPYGAYLHDGSEYTGQYDLPVDELKEFHRARLAVLADSGADLLACETIPSLLEVEALAGLLEKFSKTPVWVSCICQDDEHLSDGNRFIDALRLVAGIPSVVAVGLNCTAPRFVNALLEKATTVTDKPLVVYPNSGELYDAETCSWRSTSEAGTIEEAVRGWHERGARLIGGCCRTTPDTIRGIRAALTLSPANIGNS